MIGIPPSEKPFYQVIPIWLALVIAGLFIRPIGASGKSTTADPSPGKEESDSPYELIATILA
jgi:hypothetical protein